MNTSFSTTPGLAYTQSHFLTLRLCNAHLPTLTPPRGGFLAGSLNRGPWCRYLDSGKGVGDRESSHTSALVGSLLHATVPLRPKELPKGEDGVRTADSSGMERRQQDGAMPCGLSTLHVASNLVSHNIIDRVLKLIDWFTGHLS